MYVIGLSFSYVSVGYSSSRSRGAVHSVNLTRGVGILLCYIGPEYVLKLLRTGSIHLDSTYNVTPFNHAIWDTSARAII